MTAVEAILRYRGPHAAVLATRERLLAGDCAPCVLHVAGHLPSSSHPSKEDVIFLPIFMEAMVPVFKYAHPPAAHGGGQDTISAYGMGRALRLANLRAGYRIAYLSRGITETHCRLCARCACACIIMWCTL